jgi:hypothetical protein
MTSSSTTPRTLNLRRFEEATSRHSVVRPTGNYRLARGKTVLRAICRPFNGASRTRTGDLLGAIQACAGPEFGLFQGFRGGVRPVRRLALSASLRPFRLGSGQRNGSLARSPVGRATPYRVSRSPQVRQSRAATDASAHIPAARPRARSGSRGPSQPLSGLRWRWPRSSGASITFVHGAGVASFRDVRADGPGVDRGRGVAVVVGGSEPSGGLAVRSALLDPRVAGRGDAAAEQLLVARTPDARVAPLPRRDARPARQVLPAADPARAPWSCGSLGTR